MKETIIKVKRQSSEWEKIIVNETTGKELISKIYKELMKLNTKKQTTQSKIGQNTYTDISPKKAAKSCPTLCDFVDCSMPGFPVLHYHPEFAQVHVH